MSEDIYLRVRISDEEAKDRINNLKLKALQADYEIEIVKYRAEEAERIGKEAEEQALLAIELAKEAEVRARRSFSIVMAGMRTSYLMFSGLSRILGGGMTQIFRTMYSVGMAAVGTYTAVAAAMGATGVGLPQALLMEASLIVASTQLIMLLSGQKEMATNMRGLNMMLHGVSGMIGSFSLG